MCSPRQKTASSSCSQQRSHGRLIVRWWSWLTVVTCNVMMTSPVYSIRNISGSKLYVAHFHSEYNTEWTNETDTCCGLLIAEVFLGFKLMPTSTTVDNAKVVRLTVTTILDPPYMMLKADSAFLAGNERFEGYLADILERLATSVGFEYEIRLSRDGRHGDLHMDMIWDGMMGDIQRGDADMAAGALVVTEKRREYFDFTEPFLSLRSSALIRKPYHHLNQQQQQPNRASSSSRGQSSKTRSSSNSQTHSQRKQHADSQPTTARRIQTAEQLLSSDLKYGVVRPSVIEQLMSSATDQLTKALWSRLITFWPPAVVDSVQEGVERARREQFAFIIDSPMAAYVSGRAPCDLYATEPFLGPMTYAFALRRNGFASVSSRRASGTSEFSAPADAVASTTPPSSNLTPGLKQSIDHHLRRMKSSGEMQAMYLRWWRDECGLDHHYVNGAVDSDDDLRRGSSGSTYWRNAAASSSSSKTGRHVTVSKAPSSCFLFCGPTLRTTAADWHFIMTLAVTCSLMIT